MRGLHLKKRGVWWHYQRRVPGRYQEIDDSGLITFALKTKNFSIAKLRAAETTLELDEKWSDALEAGKIVCDDKSGRKFEFAQQSQRSRGFDPKPTEAITDDELLDRLRLLLEGGAKPHEQKAVLGMVEKPAMSLQAAFDGFWEHIKEEWVAQSHDQKRTKRNIYLKAIRNFEKAVGPIPVYEIERSHALQLRAWFVERVKDEGIKPYTGNREINSLRRLLSVTFDIDGETKINPFARVKLKEEFEVSRIPVTNEQILQIIRDEAKGCLHSDFHLLVKLLVNTGMRPVEAMGLELADIILDHNIPHVHVRKNSVRGLKTDHSERLLPLLGISLEAAKQLVAQEGWGKRIGKNMYATTIINKHLKKTGLLSDPKQTLYSFRHWFQDQLTKRDVVDRAQAQLMGHKFQRPKYGYGKDLSELKDIIEKFAI